MTDLAAIRARHDAATPGPWRVEDDGRQLDIRAGGEYLFSDSYESDTYADAQQAHADAEFIAHAPEDVRLLLDALGAYRSALRSGEPESEQLRSLEAAALARLAGGTNQEGDAE